MDPDRKKRMQTYLDDQVLQSGEQIAWQGCASPTAASKLGVGAVLYGLLWMVFGSYWMFYSDGPQGSTVRIELLHMHWRMPATTVGGAVTMVLSLGGGFWLFTRPVRYYLRAARTLYVITDRRVLLVSDWLWRRVVRIAPSDIRDCERWDFRRGTGDIRLRRSGISGYWTPRTVLFGDGLWGIDDVKGAADAIAVLKVD